RGLERRRDPGEQRAGRVGPLPVRRGDEILLEIGLRVRELTFLREQHTSEIERVDVTGTHLDRLVESGQGLPRQLLALLRVRRRRRGEEEEATLVGVRFRTVAVDRDRGVV